MNLPALHRASEQGHAHMVALLLKHGARVALLTRAVKRWEVHDKVCADRNFLGW